MRGCALDRIRCRTLGNYPILWLAAVHPEQDDATLAALLGESSRAAHADLAAIILQHPRASVATMATALGYVGNPALVWSALAARPDARRDLDIRLTLQERVRRHPNDWRVAVEHVLTADDRDDAQFGALFCALASHAADEGPIQAARELERVGVARARGLTSADLAPLMKSTDAATRMTATRALAFVGLTGPTTGAPDTPDTPAGETGPRCLA